MSATHVVRVPARHGANGVFIFFSSRGAAKQRCRSRNSSSRSNSSRNKVPRKQMPEGYLSHPSNALRRVQCGASLVGKHGARQNRSLRAGALSFRVWV